MRLRKLMPENHYRVLNISKTEPPKQDRLKSAYRTALLAHHPDRTNNSNKIGNIISSPNKQEAIPTIDEITLAYQVLSNPRTRAEYDAELMLNKEDKKTRERLGEHRISGLEVIDLDDMAYDEEMTVWTRECRCGSGGGFMISEVDLENDIDKRDSGAIHAILVGCEGCSLSLKVNFALAEG